MLKLFRSAPTPLPAAAAAHLHAPDLVPGALDVLGSIACLDRNAVALTRLVAGAGDDLTPEQAERLLAGLRDVHGQVERACQALCRLGEPLPAPQIHATRDGHVH